MRDVEVGSDLAALAVDRVTSAAARLEERIAAPAGIGLRQAARDGMREGVFEGGDLEQHDGLAPDVCQEIKDSGVKYIEEAYDKKFIKGYLMLYSCLNDDKTDRQIVNDGKEAGVLVNIHDKPAFCQFISPAIYRRGNISVAVSSNGENVYESIRIRDLIKEKIQIN